MQRYAWIAVAMVAALAAGYVTGLHTDIAVETLPKSSVTATAQSKHRQSLQTLITQAAQAAPSVKTAVPQSALPPSNTPIKTIYADLAQRAQDGDAAAAMRLFTDLQRCSARATAAQLLAMTPTSSDAPTVGPILDRLDATDSLCAGITDAQIGKRGELLRDASLAGDASAMVCYAMSPNDFGPKFLSSEWLVYADRWRDEAPAFAAQAFASGQADVISLLFDAFDQRVSYTDGFSFTSYAFGGLVAPDAEAAYAYALLYEKVAPSTDATRAWRRVQSARAGLTSAQIEAAETFAAAQAPRFSSQAGSRENLLPCGAGLRAGAPM